MGKIIYTVIHMSCQRLLEQFLLYWGIEIILHPSRYSKIIGTKLAKGYQESCRYKGTSDYAHKR